jgi:MFS transporter, UMF1 family
LTPAKNSPRILTAWCFYDWANSVHALVVVSAIFPVYFNATARNAQGGVMLDFLGLTVKNSVLFSYTISAAFLIVAFISPICSAIADAGGNKKAFLRGFCTLGAVSCAGLVFFTRETTTLSVILFGLSLVGWAGSIVFYNSFLPDIATPDRFDQLSARGFTLGYIGSVLLLVQNLTMLLFPAWYGDISQDMASRLSFLLTGLWWFGFAQIPLYFLPNSTNSVQPFGRENPFVQLRTVFFDIRQQPVLGRFLLAFFVYSTGVQTVMYVAALFGTAELHLPDESLIATILLIQLVAIPGAYGFSWLSARMGNVSALMGAVVVWLGICAGAYLTYTQNQFFVLAAVVGLVMGGIQSLSRSTFAKFLPIGTTETTSYFSFYDVCEKLSIVFGTGLYGLVEAITGSMRSSILALLVVFVADLMLLWRVPAQKMTHSDLQIAEVS